jgi:regulator of sigma D
MQEACYGSCERNLPEKNCTENIIIFKDSKENSVTQQDKCVFIEGDLRTVDAYIYKLFELSSSL